MTVNLQQLSSLAQLFLTQFSSAPSSLFTAARQQLRRGAKMINNDCQALRVGVLDMREITRIVTSNTSRIDLPMSLRLEPYRWLGLWNSDWQDVTDCLFRLHFAIYCTQNKLFDLINLTLWEKGWHATPGEDIASMLLVYTGMDDDWWGGGENAVCQHRLCQLPCHSIA